MKNSDIDLNAVLDSNDYEALLDPEIVPYLPLLEALDVTSPLACRDYIAQRRQAPHRSESDTIEIEDFETVSDEGVLKLRLYYPDSETALNAAILSLHGGGFIMGDHDSEQARALAFAKAGFLVLSVDYPLAPEHPYPAALLNCYEALCWLWRNSKKLVINPRKILIAGSSAGGNLALAVALKSRYDRGPALAGQLLFYPAIDYRCATPSMYKNATAPIWTGKNCRDMWQQYLNLTPAEMSSTQVSYYASPAMAIDLTGLPATYISRCEFDPLCDEAEIFAQRLSDAGIKVESVFHASAVHGFDLLLPIALSRQAIAMGVAAARVFVDIDA